LTTEKSTEYKLPAYTFPYRANFDSNGELWASTMHTDRVASTIRQPRRSSGRQQPRPRAGAGVEPLDQVVAIGIERAVCVDRGLYTVQPLDGL
jgi:hypothetical protein